MLARMWTLILAASLSLFAASPTPAAAATKDKPEEADVKASEPKVGDKAPDFTLPNPDGGQFALSDYAGKKSVVVIFFPKAFTGG